MTKRLGDKKTPCPLWNLITQLFAYKVGAAMSVSVSIINCNRILVSLQTEDCILLEIKIKKFNLIRQTIVVQIICIKKWRFKLFCMLLDFLTQNSWKLCLKNIIITQTSPNCVFLSSLEVFRLVLKWGDNLQRWTFWTSTF